MKSIVNQKLWSPKARKVPDKQSQGIKDQQDKDEKVLAHS